MTALALGHRCALDEPDEHFYDHGLATNTIQRLQFAGKKLASEGTPFFIQSGFARPHTPWRVPSRFWDLYDTEDIVLAEHKLPPDYVDAWDRVHESCVNGWSASSVCPSSASCKEF